VTKDFSVIGHALSAPVRSIILNMLMDGSSRPASELADAARVSASTASEHLAVLSDAGLTIMAARGRQRFYSIADPSIAASLEQLGHLCPPAPIATYRQSRQARDLAQARLCYDHLAGRLGVALTDAMIGQGWLRDDNGLHVTDEGISVLSELGLELRVSPRSRRPLTRACPDWTERRSHVAGLLGSCLARHAVAAGWVLPSTTGRGLSITSTGWDALERHWGIERSTIGASLPR
jgi:DNA-binding transcriptional ArsR family regulator